MGTSTAGLREKGLAAVGGEHGYAPDPEDRELFLVTEFDEEASKSAGGFLTFRYR